MSLFAAARAPRHVVFGRGQRAAVAGYARDLGNRALICTDERLGGSRELAELVDSLAVAGIESVVFDRTLPEVPLSSIDRCVEAGRAFGPDMVIGLGGGSCLDIAKAASLMLAHGGSIRDYYGEFKVPGPVLPIIAIPTTAGTGSEATPVAVVADTERTLKVGIASPHLIPHVAICDPELTYSAPSGLAAVAGADAMVHAIEAYTAIRRDPVPGITQEHVFLGKNAISDSYALLAIAHLGQSLERAVKDATDHEARDGVMFGALAAGMAFGVAGCSAAHAIQYPVGASTHTTHGAGVACLLPYAMEYNLPAATPEMARVADALGLPHTEGGQVERAYAAIDAIARLFGVIGIPKSLRLLGLREDKLGWVAEQSLGATRLVKNNPRLLDLEAMTTIVGTAFSGDRLGLRRQIALEA